MGTESFSPRQEGIETTPEAAKRMAEEAREGSEDVIEKRAAETGAEAEKYTLEEQKALDVLEAAAAENPEYKEAFDKLRRSEGNIFKNKSYDAAGSLLMSVRAFMKKENMSDTELVEITKGLAEKRLPEILKQAGLN